MSEQRSPHIAIIGSGPAGFYAAEALLDAAQDPDSPLSPRVDMLDRLATPWGLLRSGVAPDHPKIKSASAQYEKTAARPGFRFFGHVELGSDVTREELLARYDALIYAVGAQTERRLGVPGEDLPGSIASVDFVGWYNGHPDYADLAPPLDTERAVIVGAGNVALDVARMLVLPDADLRTTDVADHALEALAASSVHEVLLCGRRGPTEASFTTGELRELADIAGLRLDTDPNQIPPADHPVLAEQSKATRRNLDQLRTWVRRGDAAPGQPGDAADRKRLEFRFLRSPVAIRGEGRVEEVELAVNRLEPYADGRVKAVDTGVRETVSAGLVLRAVGYRGVALDGVPFDQISGTIPHEDGKVLGRDREYVVGWIKRGPSGIIGTNRKDATETVRTLLATLQTQDVVRDPAIAGETERWLRHRCPELVDQQGWEAIDAHERDAGAAAGRPRIKVTGRDIFSSLTTRERAAR